MKIMINSELIYYFYNQLEACPLTIIQNKKSFVYKTQITSPVKIS